MNSTAFLFSHFEYRTPGPDLEQVQFSISRDGLRWELLNGGDPVLENHSDDGGLRDPFVFRKRDNTFVLLATDLNIALRKNGWKDAVANGSNKIILFESPDLVHWSAPRAVVMPLPDATCAWAPEVIDDDGRYLVIWSARRRGMRTKVYGAYTEDFIRYNTPFVFCEGEMDVIDTTVVRWNNLWYRFTKDESSQSILPETASSLVGPWTRVKSECLSAIHGVEGPICTILPDGRALLLLDCYGVGPDASYIAFLSDDLAAGMFVPAGGAFRPSCRMKHGTIMPITTDEYERLKEHSWK